MTYEEVEEALFDKALQLQLQGIWRYVRLHPQSKLKRGTRGRWKAKVICDRFPSKTYEINDLTHYSEIRNRSLLT